MSGVDDWENAVKWREVAEKQVSEMDVPDYQKGNVMRAIEKTWMYLSELVPDYIKVEYARRKSQ